HPAARVKSEPHAGKSRPAAGDSLPEEGGPGTSAGGDSLRDLDEDVRRRVCPGGAVLSPAVTRALRRHYAGAEARGLRFGTWIARPSATRPASLIASESVGCGAMPSATVSTVDSASIATTPASIMSVTCGPTMIRPSSSPYFVSWIDLTQPTVSSCMTARAFATHGNCPTATSSPYCSRACASVRPTPAISGSV